MPTFAGRPGRPAEDDDERASQARTADDDLAELATDRTSGIDRGRRALRELLDAGLDRIPPQELGHSLHRLRPRGHGRRVIRRTLVASSCVVSTTLVTTEINRIARRESLFRDVNERIAETAENLGSEDAVFVCECAAAGCDERLPAQLDEYQQVREDGVRFLVAPGHEESSTSASSTAARVPGRGEDQESPARRGGRG